MCAAWLRENRIHSLLLLAKQDGYMLCFCTCFRPPLFSLFSSIVIIILVHKNKLQSFTSAFIILFHRSLATQVSTFYHQPSTISFKTKTYFSTISFKWSDRQYERGEERKIIRRCVFNDWQCSLKKYKKRLFVYEDYYATLRRMIVLHILRLFHYSRWIEYIQFYFSR